MLILPGTDYLSTRYDDLDLKVAGLSRPIVPSAFDFPNIGPVEFESKPPQPGGSDTIRKRLEPAHLPYAGARAAISIEWTLVSIGSRVPVTFNGKQYNVYVSLTPGKASLGKMEIIRSNVPTELGGIFYSSVLVLFTATFTNVADSSDVISIEDKVLMSTNLPGRWGVEPHRAIKIYSNSSFPNDLANRHEDLRPDMYDFYQLGGVFEGKPMRGGMASAEV